MFGRQERNLYQEVKTFFQQFCSDSFGAELEHNLMQQIIEDNKRICHLKISLRQTNRLLFEAKTIDLFVCFCPVGHTDCGQRTY